MFSKHNFVQNRLNSVKIDKIAFEVTLKWIIFLLCPGEV